MSVPYIDHSAEEDSTSSASANPAPALPSVDIKSQKNSQHTTPPGPPQLATTTQDSEDKIEDKIIITSVPVPSGVSRPYKNLFHRLMPAIKAKVVLMPQSEHAKYFAKDKQGNYVGTEPEREWTEKELDERYGRYKSALPVAPARREPQLWGGGGQGRRWGMALGRVGRRRRWGMRWGRDEDVRAWNWKLIWHIR